MVARSIKKPPENGRENPVRAAGTPTDQLIGPRGSFRSQRCLSSVRKSPLQKGELTGLESIAPDTLSTSGTLFPFHRDPM